MNLISVKNLSHTEGGRTLFSNITLGIDEGEKIALLGFNGCGKSTLLRLLSGYREAESGTVARNSILKCSFLEQNPCFEDDETIADFILSGSSEDISVIREYETLSSDIRDGNGESIKRFSFIMEEMDRLDCWSLESRIHSILSELGIDNLSQKMNTLSGGMVKKAAIARTLVIDSNLIILDEPTNHLDIRTIRWLEKYLSACSRAVLLVTHDRYFMDAVCSRILEIDDNTLYSYNGNYSGYLSARSDRENSRVRGNERIRSILRTESEWIKRGPKARAGKDRKRKERYFDLRESLTADKASSSSFEVAGKRLGGKILDITDVEKKYPGITAVTAFTFSFRKGDRVGIIGPNGSGKTTILNIIAGITAPDRGTVDRGLNTKIGYYDQMSKELPSDMRAVDYIEETAEVITLRDGKTVSPSRFLEMFLFPKNLLYTEISSLSGGEKKKLYLLKILLENPNFLIFDEPTNDFDLQTLSILEDFLTGFNGCTVVVSHDRFFLDRTTDFLFILDGTGSVSGYSGDVTDYFNETGTQETVQEKKTYITAGNTSGKNIKRTRGLSYSEKRELETIEDDILALETEKEDLEKIFVSSLEVSPGEMKKTESRYKTVISLIEEKYARWEALESAGKQT